MANSGVQTALNFVLILNVFLFLAQASMIGLEPNASVIYNCENSFLSEFDKNNCVGDPVLDTDEVISQLPDGAGGTDASNNNFFSDILNSIKDWFLDSTGLNYLKRIVSAPYNILKAMNLDNNVTYALGTLWYGISLFAVVSFFWGRN